MVEMSDDMKETSAVKGGVQLRTSKVTGLGDVDSKRRLQMRWVREE